MQDGLKYFTQFRDEGKSTMTQAVFRPKGGFSADYEFILECYINGQSREADWNFAELRFC